MIYHCCFFLFQYDFHFCYYTIGHAGLSAYHLMSFQLNMIWSNNWEVYLHSCRLHHCPRTVSRCTCSSCGTTSTCTRNMEIPSTCCGEPCVSLNAETHEAKGPCKVLVMPPDSSKQHHGINIMCCDGLYCVIINLRDLKQPLDGSKVNKVLHMVASVCMVQGK